jgi:hypothetical protein
MTSSLLYPNYNPIIYSSHLVLEAAFSSLPYPTRLVITFLPGQFLPCAYGRVILRLSILFPGLAACPAHSRVHARIQGSPDSFPVQYPCSIPVVSAQCLRVHHLKSFPAFRYLPRATSPFLLILVHIRCPPWRLRFFMLNRVAPPPFLVHNNKVPLLTGLSVIFVVCS